MGYILENRTLDGRPDGYYEGPNKKYHDMFNLTPSKKFAHVFENKEDADKKEALLNKIGWNFKVLSV